MMRVPNLPCERQASPGFRRYRQIAWMIVSVHHQKSRQVTHQNWAALHTQVRASIAAPSADFLGSGLGRPTSGVELPQCGAGGGSCDGGRERLHCLGHRHLRCDRLGHVPLISLSALPGIRSLVMGCSRVNAHQLAHSAGSSSQALITQSGLSVATLAR